MTETLKIGREDAEEYTEALTMGISALQFFAQFGADDLGIPDALGLSSEEWGRRVIGGGKVWRNPDERRQLSVHLTAPTHEGGKGLSNVKAAEALGVDEGTVRNDKRKASESSETGLNGEQCEQVSDAVNDEDSESSEEPLWPDDTIEADGGSESSTPADEADGRNLTPAGGDTQQVNTDPPSPPVNDGDEWYTPPWLFRALGIEFSLDVCAPLDQTYSAVPADKHLTVEDDGLAQHWEGTVWCNPPYSKPEPWARRLIHHGDGLLLTHIPMNAGWAVDVWESCDAIRLFQAMEFVRPDGTSQRPGYWLQLAAFGPLATEALGRIQPLGDAAFNKRRVASPMWRRAS